MSALKLTPAATLVVSAVEVAADELVTLLELLVAVEVDVADDEDDVAVLVGEAVPEEVAVLVAEPVVVGALVVPLVLPDVVGDTIAGPSSFVPAHAGIRVAPHTVSKRLNEPTYRIGKCPLKNLGLVGTHE